MELKAFIKQSLIEIISGVDEAASQVERDICFVHRNSENVQFDIAVTVENSKGKEGGIKVASLLSGGMSSESKNSTISRLSFQLYIPSKKN
jgi:hypothetical protein